MRKRLDISFLFFNLKLRRVLTSLLVVLTSLVKSQDMHFTQFYAAPLYLNPAFTGANVCSRISLTYRNQWPGVKMAYQSYLVSYDHYLQAQHLGIGLMFATDQAGSGGLRTTLINPSFAFETKINKNIGIRFGLQPGVTIKSIQFDKLLFGDQIARGGSANPTSVATVETPTQSKTFVDIGAGTLLYTSNLWIGTSFYHLNKPNESLVTGTGVTLPVKYSVHGGSKLALNKDEKDSDLRKYVSIVMNYRGQGKFDQFDLGVYYSQRLFSIGMWYRGLPGFKSYLPGYANNDAMAFLVGMQAPKLNIGYSYDITISKLTNLTKGAHEITLSFQICAIKQKPTKRLTVSCPKF